jgi:hypothetical protein
LTSVLFLPPPSSYLSLLFRPFVISSLPSINHSSFLLPFLTNNDFIVIMHMNIFKKHILNIWGARGSVVAWGTMVQAGRSQVRIPMKWIFFNIPNPSSCTLALGSTQPLTEMSTRNLPGVKGGRRVKLTNLHPSAPPMGPHLIVVVGFESP